MTSKEAEHDAHVWECHLPISPLPRFTPIAMALRLIRLVCGWWPSVSLLVSSPILGRENVLRYVTPAWDISIERGSLAAWKKEMQVTNRRSNSCKHTFIFSNGQRTGDAGCISHWRRWCVIQSGLLHRSVTFLLLDSSSVFVLPALWKSKGVVTTCILEPLWARQMATLGSSHVDKGLEAGTAIWKIRLCSCRSWKFAFKSAELGMLNWIYCTEILCKYFLLFIPRTVAYSTIGIGQ